jgi:formylglycine-generating enzyme required for sulfatase activity
MAEITDAMTTMDSNGMIQGSVPMSDRGRGVAGGTNTAPPGMVLIPAGSFTMGDTFNEGCSSERPTHSVYISAFYMDTNEVSKAQWDEVHQWDIANGYGFDWVGSGKAPNHPVQRIRWYDLVKWCNARSEKEGLVPAYYTKAAQSNVYRTGQTNVLNDWVKWTAGYRLPTEAEWEKAARGEASGHRFPWSDVDTISHSRANYEANTHSHAYDVSPTQGYHSDYVPGNNPCTSPVASFAANGYGLYDMAGNVFEWCWDWYDPSW